MMVTRKYLSWDAQQITIVLCYLGEQGIQIYNTFSLPKQEIKIIVTAFEKYCNLRKNIVYERCTFFNTNQKPN